MSRNRKIAVLIGGIIIAGFVILQVFPIGRFREVFQHNPNPPVLINIEWDTLETHQLVRSACYDCHSNETVYPWYSQIAPISWLVTRDVNNGRKAMNFSEDAGSEYNLDDLEGHLYSDMPPRFYILMHPEAQLSDEQKERLMAGFRATFIEASHDGMDMSD